MTQDVDLIKDMIVTNQHKSRTQLSHKVCKALNLYNPNGKLKDMSCCVVLLKMSRKGIINPP